MVVEDVFWVRKMSLNFEIFRQTRSSNSKQSGHLMSADWENHCLSKKHCASFPEGDCLRVARMQVGFPCELAKHVDCVLTGNQADFQESSLVSSFCAPCFCWSAVSGKYLCFSAFVYYTDNLGIHTYLAMSAEPLFPPVLHLPCPSIMNSSSLGINKCPLPYSFFKV